MSFFCQNAQEEALKEIAFQMKVTNKINMLRELLEHGDISEEAYLKGLKEILKIT